MRTVHFMVAVKKAIPTTQPVAVWHKNPYASASLIKMEL